jgi:hypothetical protein
MTSAARITSQCGQPPRARQTIPRPGVGQGRCQRRRLMTHRPLRDRCGRQRVHAGDAHGARRRCCPGSRRASSGSYRGGVPRSPACGQRWHRMATSARRIRPGRSPPRRFASRTSEVGMSEPGMTRRASPRDVMPPCRHSDQRHRKCSWSPADAMDQTEESDGDTARGRRGAMVVAA